MGTPAFEPLKPDYLGRHPHRDGPNGPTVNGPFGYIGAERDARGNTHGFSTGMGLLSGRMGDKARGDIMQAQAHFGGWRDESGRTNYGVEGDAALARAGLSLNGAIPYFGFDVGALTANAHAKVNDETAGIGAQANLIEGSATIGDEQNNLRVGGSIGVGLAGRVHYGDADRDGVREYGVGFDLGPFSADIKSELIGHAVNGVNNAGRWVGNQASRAWDTVTSW